MKLYWFQNDIPALQGLTRQQCEEAKRAVIHQVWSHWQVWFPQVVQICAFLLFITCAPRFPYRFLIVIAAVLITTRLAALPFHHYLNYYLNRRSSEPSAIPTSPRPSHPRARDDADG